jgi:DHA1 family tetracycline resistance protein-like MFS transporter
MFTNKRLIPLFIVVFVDILGFSLILPLLPYYASSFNASPQTIGFLVASYSVFQFIGAPILGDLSDRYGRRPLFLYSQIGSFAGFILMGAAIHLPNPLLWLFVARIIDGISGGNLTIAQAYIGDVTKPQERAKAFGMVIGVAFGLGFLIGPALGGFLSEYGFDVPAYAAAGMSLTSIIATILLLPETERSRDPERKSGLAAYTRVLDYLHVPGLNRLLVVFLFFALPFSLYISMFALYADLQLDFSAKQTGYFLAFVGLLGIVWQGAVVGPVVRILGEKRTMLAGLIFSAIGIFATVWVDVWWKLGVVAFFFSLGNSITRPSLTSLITERGASPPAWRGHGCDHGYRKSFAHYRPNPRRLDHRRAPSGMARMDWRVVVCTRYPDCPWRTGIHSSSGSDTRRKALRITTSGQWNQRRRPLKLEIKKSPSTTSSSWVARCTLTARPPTAWKMSSTR